MQSSIIGFEGALSLENFDQSVRGSILGMKLMGGAPNFILGPSGAVQIGKASLNLPFFLPFPFPFLPETVVLYRIQEQPWSNKDSELNQDF